MLHSKSGMQLEVRLQEIIRGGVVKDLGDVSAVQLQALDRFVLSFTNMNFSDIYLLLMIAYVSIGCRERQ